MSDSVSENAPPRQIPLANLPDELNDSCYLSGKYPLLLDPTGTAFNFLKYRARCLSVLKFGDFEPESLRKGLVQTMHNGAWLVLDTDQIDTDWSSLIDSDGKCFPIEALLGPEKLFNLDVYNKLPRPSDEFAARVAYENLNIEQEGLMDRTKAFEPEKCVDIDKRFQPLESFRLIITSKKSEPPSFLADKMEVMTLSVPQSVQSGETSAVWAGGDAPVEARTKDQQKLDKEFLECSFDGDLVGVKEYLEKGADSNAIDGRKNTALSEAACAGHIEVVNFLLSYKPPLGSDPNAQNSDGRTALHRAAFGGHKECVNSLLTYGGDPRIKDKNRESCFDIATDPEMHALLDSWKEEDVLKILEERKLAREAAEESMVKNDEERKKLLKSRKVTKMFQLIEEGDKDGLDIECIGIEGNISTYRDERGNSLLHMAAWHGRLEICEFLLQELNIQLEGRDNKGWTSLQIAAFHGNRKVCELLCNRGANPESHNSYRKNAIDLAKDDEVKECLLKYTGRSGPKLGDGPTDGAPPEPTTTATAPPAAAAKAKAKAAAAVAKGAAPFAKAAAKGKAKAKAGAK